MCTTAVPCRTYCKVTFSLWKIAKPEMNTVNTDSVAPAAKLLKDYVNHSKR